VDSEEVDSEEEIEVTEVTEETEEALVVEVVVVVAGTQMLMRIKQMVVVGVQVAQIHLNKKVEDGALLLLNNPNKNLVVGEVLQNQQHQRLPLKVPVEVGMHLHQQKTHLNKVEAGVK
jgi:hypothetical protein